MVSLDTDRRDFLKATGATAGLGMFAGCTGGDGGDGGDGGEGGDGSDGGEDVYRANLGTASEGGAFQIIGAGLAEIWNDHEGLEINAITTGGGMENVSLLNDGQVELAIIDSSQMWMSIEAELVVEEPIPVTSVERLFANPNWFTARADSDIERLTDLEGRPVGVGPQGSGGNYLTELIFDIAGIEIEPRYLTFSEATDGIATGDVDAMLVYGVLPAVMELSEQVDLMAVPYDEDVLDDILQEPWAEPSELPPPLSDVDNSDTPVFEQDIFIAALEDVPEQATYQIAKQTFENIERTRETHVLTSGADIELATRNVGGVAPIHPGAAQYYEEEGVL